MKKDFKVFKSEEGRRKILSSYSKMLETVSFRYKERYVSTTFGKTYVLEAGDPEKPAIILIHGSCSNSAAWFADIPVLAEQYHVFSVDIVGDAGNSEENRLDPKTTEFENWLKEVFDGLDLTKAILIGNSLGGWISLRFAAKNPHRVEKLALIAPAGIAPIRASFLAKTILYLPLGEKGREAISRTIFGKDKIPEEVADFLRLIMDGFNPLTGDLPPLQDEELKKLAMPFFYIAGADDALMDVGKAAKRLKRLLPDANIHVIKNNGHAIYDAKPWLLPFLQNSTR